jgi:hypothetical protein
MKRSVLILCFLGAAALLFADSAGVSPAPGEGAGYSLSAQHVLQQQLRGETQNRLLFQARSRWMAGAEDPLEAPVAAGPGPGPGPHAAGAGPGSCDNDCDGTPDQDRVHDGSCGGTPQQDRQQKHGG